MMMPFKGLRLRLVEHKVFSYSSDDGHQFVSGIMILLLLILINELMMEFSRSGVFCLVRKLLFLGSISCMTLT
jgi:uncharacterized membrane protein YgdD (TMEM256/DUF423 family)